jgi:hypothetical protein
VTRDPDTRHTSREDTVADGRRPHFADHGSEKMIFDARMGPQALYHDDTIYAVYQANPDGFPAHPHLRAYDCRTRTWSRVVRLGENPPRYDHHLAPVVWMDDAEHLHVLYGCHITPGTHLIARRSRVIDDWREGPRIAASISYPTVVPVHGGRLLLFYRGLGHLGFWAYRTSGDGGHSWTDARRLIDFDRDPREDDDADCWAGSYASVCRDADGRSLHIGFVYWDERKLPHPIYQIGKRSKKRYNLYYLRLDVASGALHDASGVEITPPVNRRAAEERCGVWNTGHELTNMPAIAVGSRDEPYFVLPVSDGSPWRCRFYLVARKSGRWQRFPIAETNGNWAGCLLDRDRSGGLTAYLVRGEEGETLLYSGGMVERWRSTNEGTTWKRERSLVPEAGLLYNNPRPVHLVRGGRLADCVVFFGWQGPGSIQSDPSPRRNRGRAYLWREGEWL